MSDKPCLIRTEQGSTLNEQRSVRSSKLPDVWPSTCVWRKFGDDTKHWLTAPMYNHGDTSLNSQIRVSTTRQRAPECAVGREILRTWPGRAITANRSGPAGQHSPAYGHLSPVHLTPPHPSALERMLVGQLSVRH